MNLRVLTPWLVGIGLVVISAAGRLAPHPPNFVPVAAAALFAGFFFKHRVSSHHSASCYGDQRSGDWWIRLADHERGLRRIGVACRAAAIHADTFGAPSRGLFACQLYRFLSRLECGRVGVLANVCAAAAGLAACYLAALPFLAYTVAGDLFWSGVFFGAYSVCSTGELQRFCSRMAASSCSRSGTAT